MNQSRRNVTLLPCALLIITAGCAEYEETADDKAAKPRFVGNWYWTYEWLSRGAIFHVLTNRKSDGTLGRLIRVIHKDSGAIETSEESGRWGVNLGRYVEKILVEDGKAVGVGEKEKRFVVKAISDTQIELEGERVKGEPRIETKVDERFRLP